MWLNQASSQNEQEEEEAAGMKPFAFDAYSQVTYQVRKISATPKEAVCAPHIDASTRQQELLQRKRKEQLVLRPFDELFSKKDPHVKMDAAEVEHEVCLQLVLLLLCRFRCGSEILSPPSLVEQHSDCLRAPDEYPDRDIRQKCGKSEGAKETSACTRTW